MQNIHRENGFTLIEVVLVLAIAGLIIIIVFAALSGAQKSRRDTQRKRDASRILAAIEQCAGNHEGKYGACLPDPGSAYFSGSDPFNTAYIYTLTSTAGSPPAPSGTAAPVYVTATPCTGHAVASAAVRVYQEGGSAYCVDNGS